MSSVVTTAHLRTKAIMRACPSEEMLHLGPLLPPPDPPDEEKRLQTMRVLGLDAETWPPDPMLDTMCTTVGKIMDMPQVGISIVQNRRLHMRAAIGMGDGYTCSREGAFCSWTLLPNTLEVMVVEDATKDARFRTLYDVTGPDHLRFYAGAPLLASDGQRVGAVCVLDVKPRKMTAEWYNLLANFCEITMRRLEDLAAEKLRPSQSLMRLLRSKSELKQPLALCEFNASRPWSVLWCSAGFSEATGFIVEKFESETKIEEFERGFWKLFRAAGRHAQDKVEERAKADIAHDREFSINVQSRVNDDCFRLTFRSSKHFVGNNGVSIAVPSHAAAAELGSGASGCYFAGLEKLETDIEALRLEDSQTSSLSKKLKRPKQHTFFSAQYLREHPSAASQELDYGMRDVTLGVLCASTPGGLVYRARWKKQPVSVKVVEVKEATCVTGEEFKGLLVPMEAAISMNLSHTNLITTYKVVVEEATSTPDGPEKVVLAWVVREWTDKGTLMEALHRGWLQLPSGKPDVAAVVAVAQEVASAINYLHQRDIIHGDICPDSIMLVDDKARLASSYKDFICKVFKFGSSDQSAVPVQTKRPGMASHAAPELLSKAEVSFKTDSYAFGMLLWELYCSQAVWPSLNVSQLQRRVVAAKEQPRLPDNVPFSIQDLIHDCLDNSPEERPTFPQIQERLRHIAQEFATGKLLTALTLDTAESKSRIAFWKGANKKRSIERPVRKSLHAEVCRPSEQDMMRSSAEGKEKQGFLLKKLLGKMSV